MDQIEFLPIATFVPSIAPLGMPESLGLGLCALLGAILCRALGKLRGTTLIAPCGWALIAVAGLACCLWSEGSQVENGPEIRQSALRFSMVVLSFCPLMGVLGAKRPQNHGWQWVVLTLWIIVVWPAAQAALLPQGVRLELFIAWKLFLVGLIGIGLLNYLPTRYGLSAMLVAMGQLIMLDEYLGGWGWIHSEWVLTGGIACFTCAAVLAWVSGPRVDVEGGPLQELNKDWSFFRDGFGAFWALRILGRINHTAELQDIPIRLSWAKFESSGDAPSEAQVSVLQKQMETLLRRFV